MWVQASAGARRTHGQLAAGSLDVPGELDVLDDRVTARPRGRPAARRPTSGSRMKPPAAIASGRLGSLIRSSGIELGEELDERGGDRPLARTSRIRTPGSSETRSGPRPPSASANGRSPGPGGRRPMSASTNQSHSADDPRAPLGGPPRSCRPTPRAARRPGRTGSRWPDLGLAPRTGRGSNAVASVDWSSTTVIVRFGILLRRGAHSTVDCDVRLLVPCGDDRRRRPDPLRSAPRAGVRNRNQGLYASTRSVGSASDGPGERDEAGNAESGFRQESPGRSP